MKTLISALLIIVILGSPAPALAQASCPPGDAQAQTRIQNLLSHPQEAELRARFNLGTATTADVHVLSNPTDRAVCSLLWAAADSSGWQRAPSDQVFFFRSGNRFFVAIINRPPANDHVIHLDHRSVIEIYDSELRLVARFGA